MRVRLDYGRTGLEVELPDRSVVRTLNYQPAQPLSDPQAHCGRCLPGLPVRPRWPIWLAGERMRASWSAISLVRFPTS
jgi:hypothetical protein